jgi:hypothetical protein
MKKLALIIAVVGMIGLSSCAKSGTECSQTTLGVKQTYTIDDGKVEWCVVGVCQDLDLGGETEADYIAGLEDQGYTCT